LDSELKGLGVYDNKHTPYSLNILQTRNNQFDTSVKNFISDLNEEKELNARAAALQAEYEARLALENLHINFNKAVQELNAFLENANDTLSDPIKADTVEDVQELQSQFDAVSQQVPSQTEKFNSINQTASELQGKGVNLTGLDEINNKWAAFQSDFQARSSALSAEHARQSANEALRVQFANSAKELQDWIDSHSAAVNAAGSGSLEDQLADVKNRKADISAGSSKLSALEALNTSLDEAGVTSNRHTNLTFASLKAAYSQLLRTVGDKESLIQKEIIAKAGQGITPEQFAEFKEVFEHFDKDSTGNLSRLEFKSCLQSLGEDPTDADLDRLVGTLGKDGKIPFDAFVQHMSQRAADSDTKEQILEAFKIVAGDKEFVTAEDLRKVLPTEKVEYLIKNIPLYKGIEGSYDYSAWANSAFSG
jgi:actinin alpha